MTARDIPLGCPVRTAIGGFNGSLKTVPKTEFGAIVIGEAIRRARIAPDAIGSVVTGNVIQAGNRMKPARQAAIGALALEAL